MGLDWEPLPIPKKGQEKEFEDLFHKLAAARGSRRDRLLEWFANASTPAYSVIGAPRVGYDEAADEWLVKRVEKQQRMEELEEIKREMRGYCVLALLPPCDGFPVYSNYVASDSLERYAFNAELVIAEHAIIGDELWERAHSAMLPGALAEFAEKLHEVAQRFVLEHGLPSHVETIREPVFPEGSRERSGHVLFAAAKWATYWSYRGHGLMPV